MGTVLVVDDEPIVRDVVVRYLEQEGYRTLQAGDGETARGLLEQELPSLVVLDLMLPGMDGLALCRWIRGRSELPVIMVTALGEEADRLTGLDIGADDYLTKPFSPRELVARIKAVLRRTAARPVTRERIECGDLVIDSARREARKDGAPLRLTALEFDLLRFLAGHPDEVFTRDELMERVWGYTSALDTGTVTVHVRRLQGEDRGRPVAASASRDGVGRGLPVHGVIQVALFLALGTIAVGLAAALLLRLLPTVRLQLVGLALFAVVLPLAGVLASGWVMFHMHDDAKILAVSSAAALSAVVGALLLAGWILKPLDRLQAASAELAAGNLAARAPRTGPREFSQMGESFNAMAESIERLFEARRELVAWASHDLRTPLASMQAMVEAIDDGLADATEYLPALHDHVHMLSMLVDDLFELARIDAGVLTLELRDAAIDGVVESCVRGFEAEARAKRIHLETRVEAPLPQVGVRRRRWSASSITCSRTRSTTLPPTARSRSSCAPMPMS